MKSTLMIGWATLMMSLAIAACAAFFSIAGLAVLFAAAIMPVIVMTSTLEVGKLAGTFFLHRYWLELPKSLKYPITGMVMILMVITSMGIFGFLSKGHIEQETPAATASIQIDRIDQQIASQYALIDRQGKRLETLQGIVDTLIEYDRIRGPDGADATLKTQQSERVEIQQTIDQAFATINDLEEKKLPLSTEISLIEAKLGPIKYVAELFGYDLADNPEGKGKAVRIVIFMFMLAFDPLAIWLIMASDWAFLKYRRERAEIGEQEEEEKKQNGVDRVGVDELEFALTVLADQLEEKKLELQRYLDLIQELEMRLDEKPTEVEKIVEVENTEAIDALQEEISRIEEEMNGLRMSLAETRDELSAANKENGQLRSDIEARDKAVEKLNTKYSLVEKIGLKADDEDEAVTSFGTEFPSKPKKGQRFLRVDQLPSNLYEFDGSRWLEVMKTDEIEYDEQYLQHLIGELSEGKVEITDLSDKEQAQIDNLLKKEDVIGK